MDGRGEAVVVRRQVVLAKTKVPASFENRSKWSMRREE